MDARNAKYLDHVARGRFPDNTDATNRAVCVACHTQANGFADSWRAPSRFSDFTIDTGTVRNCSEFRSRLSGRQNMVRHLGTDELVLWGIDHIPGLTRAQWHAAVEGWNSMNLRCPGEDPPNTYYNPWYKVGGGATL